MQMKISVFGLGYVGCVSAAWFATHGFDVVGVEVDARKVARLNEGRSPIVEPGLEALLAQAVQAGTLRATTEVGEAVQETDVSLVCVGTPSQDNGSLNLGYVKRVCRQIGEALETKRRPHLVVLRSTMLPGTVERLVIPTLEIYAGKRAGRDFHVAVNPEFLREGTSLQDFAQPPFTLIGADDEDAAAPLARLYREVDAPLIVTGCKEAEMIKYACNAFHALKVTFANEIGNVCQGLGVNSQQVMEVFCQDHKLNLSAYYLKPGFAFGGSCLPKDVRALTQQARALDLETPVLGSILLSNRLQIARAVELVLRTGRRKIGVIGLSFKPGTDDLRESPLVALIETLLGKGLELAIYDREVELARLHGANKEFIERGLPHLAALLCPALDTLISQSEVLVIGKHAPEFDAWATRLPPAQQVIDLVPLPAALRTHPHYQLIC